MRRIRVIAALAAVLLCGAARAGVYDLDDPAMLHIPPLPFDHDSILLVLAPLRAAAVPVVPDQSPEQVKKLADDLEAKAPAERTTAERLKLGVCFLRLGRPTDAARELANADDNDYLIRLYRRLAELESRQPADLTTADRIGLGACYIRLNRPNEAIRVLSDVGETDRGNFLVQANLAAAYQGINELGRAVEYEKQALAAWPSMQPGWSSLQLSWYRRTEGYNLILLQSRLRESRANPPNKAVTTPDPIFGEPRQPAGDYDAFEQPWALWDDLPPDAFDVTAQLLVWAPNDDRLYWQLGEVLNTVSPGSAPEAAKIFDELANRSLSGVKEFRQHRQALKDSLPVVNALALSYGNDTPRFVRDFHYFLADMAPPAPLLPPGVGGATNAVEAAATAEWYAKQAQQQPPGAPLAVGPRGWLPDWQMIFVGFAAGLIVATLGALQWTEWRRRRHAAVPPPAPPARTPPPQRTEPVVHDAGAFQTDARTAPDRMEGAP